MELEDIGYMTGKRRQDSSIYFHRWYPLIFMSLSLLFYFEGFFYYFLIDVGRIVKRRMKWIGELRKMTYEKVWIKGVEWVGGRHGGWMYVRTQNGFGKWKMSFGIFL